MLVVIALLLVSILSVSCGIVGNQSTSQFIFFVGGICIYYPSQNKAYCYNLEGGKPTAIYTLPSSPGGDLAPGIAQNRIS